MNNNIELKDQNNLMNLMEVPSIEALKEETKISMLEAFYHDESVFGKVISIITGKNKIKPSDLVNNLESVRGEYKKLDSANDEEFELVA